MHAAQSWMLLQWRQQNLACVTVQEEVQRRTNTVVVIKGRYIAPGKPVDDQEGPLRLLVKPGHMPPVRSLRLLGTSSLACGNSLRLLVKASHMPPVPS